MFNKVLAALGAASLVVAPTVASANPASSLSVASSVRASNADQNSELAGVAGGWLPVLVLGAVAVVAIVLLTNDDDDGPDSR